MTVIGIYDGHNSSASLSINGEIVCAVQEERFTKRKNETGFPVKSLQYIVKKYTLDNSSIDIIAVSGTDRTDLNNLEYPIDTVFSIDDYIDMMEDYWKPKLLGKEYPKEYAKQIFKKKYPNIAKNIVCVLIIKTTLATVVLLIETTNAIKNARSIIRNLVEYIQRSRSKDLEKARIRVKYGNKYGEIIIIKNKMFIINNVDEPEKDIQTASIDSDSKISKVKLLIIWMFISNDCRI